MRKDNEIVIFETGHRISPSGKFRIEAVHTEGRCCAGLYSQIVRLDSPAALLFSAAFAYFIPDSQKYIDSKRRQSTFYYADK